MLYEVITLQLGTVFPFLDAKDEVNALAALIVTATKARVPAALQGEPIQVDDGLLVDLEELEAEVVQATHPLGRDHREDDVDVQVVP